MALTGTGLATAMKAAIAALPEDGRDHDAVWDAVANAIVDYLVTNAQVNIISVSGVTSGSASSGPGTGTLL